MNKVFDYNGTFVSPSRPVKELKTVKKTLLIDSRDRDTTKYYTNGDVVYYLPRVYENVVSVRLKSATFPPLIADTSAGALEHQYINGKNISSSNYTNDVALKAPDVYFLIDIEGLNKLDETTLAAQRSTYADSFFGRITGRVDSAGNIPFINYNDNTEEENKVCYFPALGKLDRLHIVTRTHPQQDRTGFIYWTDDGAPIGAENSIADYSLVFELEMLDNKFDDFSSFETRIATRADGSIGLGGYGC